MRQVGATLVGLFTGFFLLLFIIALGTTSIHVYTVNTFHNGVLFFVLLISMSIASEFVLDSCSREVMWDAISALIITVIATIFFYKKSGLLFTGDLELFEILKKIWLPVLLQMIMSIAGSSGISKAIEKSKK